MNEPTTEGEAEAALEDVEQGLAEDLQRDQEVTKDIQKLIGGDNKQDEAMVDKKIDALRDELVEAIESKHVELRKRMLEFEDRQASIIERATQSTKGELASFKTYLQTLHSELDGLREDQSVALKKAVQSQTLHETNALSIERTNFQLNRSMATMTHIIEKIVAAGIDVKSSRQSEDEELNFNFKQGAHKTQPTSPKRIFKGSMFATLKSPHASNQLLTLPRFLNSQESIKVNTAV